MKSEVVLFVCICAVSACTSQSASLEESAVSAQSQESVMCPDLYAPVCGTDLVTYGNACLAKAAGATVDYLGECGPALCGGWEGGGCGPGHYCHYLPGQMCGWSDQLGSCQKRPEVCTDEYKPVCGCNAKTYGNACEANAEGTSVRHQGECSN